MYLELNWCEHVCSIEKTKHLWTAKLSLKNLKFAFKKPVLQVMKTIRDFVFVSSFFIEHKIKIPLQRTLDYNTHDLYFVRNTFEM